MLRQSFHPPDANLNIWLKAKVHRNRGRHEFSSGSSDVWKVTNDLFISFFLWLLGRLLIRGATPRVFHKLTGTELNFPSPLDTDVAINNVRKRVIIPARRQNPSSKP